MRILAPLVLAFVLSACGGGSGGVEERTMAPEAAPAVDMAMEATAAAGPGRDEAAAAEPSPETPAAGPILLAYEYGATLEAPVEWVETLAKGHEKVCADAGPKRCQVLGLQVNRYGDDQMGATLRLRGEPAWLEDFRATLVGDAKKVGGRIVAQSMTSEDLTRQITDAEARLRAQRTLRDRLQQILRERPGKLAELLETERELARVQGEIDAAESVLAVMRARVSMSVLTLDYQTRPNPVAVSAFAPVGQAFNGFLGNVAGGLAGLITLVAVLLPWVLIGGPLAWLALRWIGRWRKKKAPPAAEA